MVVVHIGNKNREIYAFSTMKKPLVTKNAPEKLTAS
jgi:hypothetical protein